MSVFDDDMKYLPSDHNWYIVSEGDIAEGVEIGFYEQSVPEFEFVHPVVYRPLTRYWKEDDVWFRSRGDDTWMQTEDGWELL